MNILPKRQKSAKCKFFYNSKDKAVENLEHHSCLKKQNLLILEQLENCVCARVTLSNARKHFTVQSAKQNCLLTGQSSSNCKSCTMECCVSFYAIKSFETIQPSSEISFWVTERSSQQLMTDQEDNTDQGKIVLVENEQ